MIDIDDKDTLIPFNVTKDFSPLTINQDTVINVLLYLNHSFPYLCNMVKKITKYSFSVKQLEI